MVSIVHVANAPLFHAIDSFDVVVNRGVAVQVTLTVRGSASIPHKARSR